MSIMKSIKRVAKSSTFKVAAGAAAGYALGKYSPEIAAKATEVRKWTQEKRASLFPTKDQAGAAPGPGSSGGGYNVADETRRGSSGGGFWVFLA